MRDTVREITAHDGDAMVAACSRQQEKWFQLA
jgi:hypothetical protein